MTRHTVPVERHTIPAERHAVPVELDPFESAASEEHATRHITGQDDGERLMCVFTKAHASGSLAADGQLEAFHLCSVDQRTLADVPYQFLRVETDQEGAVVPDRNRRTAGRSGLLDEYFDEDATAPAWSHADQPASFHEDFPFSVDNFDCDNLVIDLEDDNDLHMRHSTHWVLWMGVATAPEPSTTADDASVVDIVSRKRILRVQDLLDRLHEVHTSLKHPAPGPVKPMVVVFIVAVSYSEQHLPARALPASSAPDATAASAASSSESEMFLAPELHDTIGPYVQRMLNKPQPPESSASSGFFTDESTSSSIPPYDGPDDDEPFTYVTDEMPGDQWYNTTESEVERDTKIAKMIYREYIRGEIKLPSYARPLFEGPDALSMLFSDEEPFDIDNPYTPSSGPQRKGKGKQPEPRPEPATDSAATPPARSIFETLDTNAAKGDAIEGDLHALLPDAESPSEEEWRTCCALLCIDPDAHRDARALSVKVPGTDNMWIKPSQLWTAYWMLASRTERGLCGGVLADVMGTGKTYVCLLVCLLRAYIGYNRAEVEREWQLREHEAKKGTGGCSIVPKQHLPKDAGGSSSSSSNIPCTCGNAMGIECYANPGGVTRRLADGLSRGASLILAPQTVLDNWVKTVKLVRLQPKYYEPVVFHGKMSKEDSVLAPAPRLRQKLSMEVRPLPSISRDGLFPHTWKPNVLEAVHEFKPSVAKDAYPERFILLATHMPEKLTEFFQVPVPLRRKAGTGGARERKTIYACPIGIQIVDEFHKAKDDAMALAQQHKHMRTSGTTGDNFDFWAITGTPLPAKLTDLETVTSLVQRLPEWDDPSSRHYAGRVVALHELQAAYEKAVAIDGTPVQAAVFRERAERFFRCGLIMRHTEASTFFGQRIFNLQDVPIKIVVHATPAAFHEDVSKVVARVGAALRKCMTGAETPSLATGDQPNWDQVVRSSSLFNHMMDLEILATFPGAARLLLTEPPEMDFGLAALRAEIRRAKDRDVTSVALFQKHLDTVVEGSAHLETILATLDEMVRDKQKRLLPAAADGEPSSSKAAPPLRKKPDASLKKLVVLCPRMGEAVFVYLALRKLRPDAHAVFVHFDLKMSERAALLRDFNRLDTGPGSRTPRVLVGTFRDAGTGNDLTVANYQILTGPLRLRSQQDQAFGRTNREGQTLRLHHRLLLTEDSPVDRIVMATQARRRIVSDPFSMTEALQLEEMTEA